MAPEKNDLELLYKNHSKAINRYLSVICRDDDLAQDITQDTFVRVQRSINTFDPAKGSFVTWAKTIAKNLCIRHKQRLSGKTDANSELVAQTADSRDSHETDFEEKNLRDAIKNAIQCLPEPERSIVYYKYRNNNTLDELAERLNISRRTVSRRYLKAMDMLKEELKKQGME